MQKLQHDPDTIVKNCYYLKDEHQSEVKGPIDILIRDGIICEMGTFIEANESETFDASGLLAIPGLINSHLHSPAAFLKGALVDAPLEIFMLRETPPTLKGFESPEICRARALLSAVEMLKRGITAVHDDAFFNPSPSMDCINAIMGAYAEVGIRATVAIDQPELSEVEKYPFLGELLNKKLYTILSQKPYMTGENLLKFYEKFITTWHGKYRGRINCAVSCSAPQRVSPDYLMALTSLSKEKDLPFNVHVLETRLQRVLGKKKFDKSLIQYLDDLGCLDERKQLIHTIWIDEDDITRISDSGAVVAYNPISNLKIGSGVMPFHALKNAKVPICLGTDEAACDDTANLWGAMKTGANIQRISIREWSNWPSADELLGCVWSGGRKSFRNDSIGQLMPGAKADIAFLNLNALSFVPLNDIRRQLVFCEDGSSVKHVFVDGNLVVRDGKISSIDEAEVFNGINEAFKEFQPRLLEIETHAKKLEPYYRKMYEISLKEEIGMTRWLNNFPD